MKKAIQMKQNGDNLDQFAFEVQQEPVRVNKYLSSAGICSRREADKMVEQRRVTIDGEVAQSGSKVNAGSVVLLDGKPVAKAEGHVYIALNKPVGITCTLEKDVQGNIGDFMNYRKRIFPVGRLDKESSGLIILTSDGDIVNKILRAENNHEKEYIVHVNKMITPEFITKISSGVEITNMRTKTRVLTTDCFAQQLGSKSFRLVLTQGLNRQIRRMCTELGYRVTGLQRIRIMNVKLGSLPVGQWRYLTGAELQELEKSF